MQKIFGKRIFRDLKENIFRYLALALLIILGMYLIVSVVGASETIIMGTTKKAEENHVEDGEFGVFVPLSENQEKTLLDEGITLERMFYLDFSHANNGVLRVFKNREGINLIALDQGRIGTNNQEIVLEKRYCEEHELSIGDKVQIAGETFSIVGVGSSPDYEAVYKSLSDSAIESKSFGTAFVTEGTYDKLKVSGKSEKSEEYQYAYCLNDKITDNALKKKLKDMKFSERNLSNLTFFLKGADNPRIGAAANDQVINRLTGLVAGVIVMTLFTYVISVFVIHGIEKESSVIGALYALGVKKKDLMLHYLTLPVIVTLIASIIGALLGFSKWGIYVQLKDCYDYFSLPVLQTAYPIYLIVYSIIMPPVIAMIINYMVIQKRLSRTVLSLIRNEQKNSKVSSIKLGNMAFVSKFRIRQMLRESRTSFTVLFGMFISIFIMMLGIDCYVMCNNISIENKVDTKYEYMYIYKYPEKKVPEGGEACFSKTLKKRIYGYNLDVTMLGIDDNNPYFDVNVEKEKSQIVISTAMAQKYNLNKGDEVSLSDEEEDMQYTFKISGVTQYSAGLYAFMDIKSMRELFRENDNYYNVVLSDKKLNIASERLYNTTTKNDVNKASDVFISMMMPMVYMLSTVSAIIFCVVMYLMMKVMIDRSSFNISLIKIFGYRTKEIRKLYLNGNFYIIAVGAAISIPLAKILMDKIYPLLVSNISCGINLKFTWQLYLGIYFSIIILYFIINQLLVGKLKKMIPAEVLKNRE